MKPLMKSLIEIIGLTRVLQFSVAVRILASVVLWSSLVLESVHKAKIILCQNLAVFDGLARLEDSGRIKMAAELNGSVPGVKALSQRERNSLPVQPSCQIHRAQNRQGLGKVKAKPGLKVRCSQRNLLPRIS